MKTTAAKVRTVNSSKILATDTAVATSLTKAVAPTQGAGRAKPVMRASGNEIVATTQGASRVVGIQKEATKVGSSLPTRATKASSKAATAADTGQRLVVGSSDTAAAADTATKVTVVLDKIKATHAIRSKADGAAMNAVILAEILKAGIVERAEAITAILTSNMYVRAGQVNRSTLTIISGVRNKLTPWMRITATGEMIATKSSLTSSASGAQSATLNAAATRAVVPVRPLVNKEQLARNISNPSLDVLIP